jgi:uncharacterized protein (TIGR00369 family)
MSRNDQATETGQWGRIGTSEATVEWPDPGGLLGRVVDMDGLAVVEAIRDGALPMEAFSSALGVRVVAAESGRITLGASVDAWQVNIGVIAHGGFLSALMDAACGLAVHSTLPAGRACPHVQASYRFLRPAAPGTPLACTGQTVHRSRTLAVARAEIADHQGRLIALGESTHALIDMPKVAS